MPTPKVPKLSIPMSLITHYDSDIWFWGLKGKPLELTCFWFTSGTIMEEWQKAIGLNNLFGLHIGLHIDRWPKALKQALRAKKEGCKLVAVDPKADNFDTCDIDSFVDSIKTHIPKIGNISGRN